MEVITLFFQHLIHLCISELGAGSPYDLKNKISTISYQYVGQVKTRRGWRVQIEYGLKEAPLFLST